MPFQLNLGDITEIKCDAVVNSIGVDASKYGKLCKNIVDKADSSELVARLSVEKNGKIGSMFLTSGYSLKANNIIHVVSPFKKDDNNRNDNLKKVYDDVINFAINNNFKSIALPFLASGANGYSEEEVYKCAMESISEILEKEEKLGKKILDITLVVFLNKKNVEHTREKNSEYEKEDLFNNIHQFAKMNSMMKKEDALVPSFPYNYPYDYIIDYIEQKKIKLKVLLVSGFDRRRRYRLSTYKDIPRDDVYRLIFALNMNFTEAMQFMTICGVAMSPCRKIDIFFRDYLLGKYGKVNSLITLNNLSYGFIEPEYSFLKN